MNRNIFFQNFTFEYCVSDQQINKVVIKPLISNIKPPMDSKSSKFIISSSLLKLDNNDYVVRKCMYTPSFASPYPTEDIKDSITFTLFEQDEKQRIWFPDLKTRESFNLPLSSEDMFKELAIAERWFITYRNFDLCNEYINDYRTKLPMVKTLLATKIPKEFIDSKEKYIQQHNEWYKSHNKEPPKCEVDDYSGKDLTYADYLRQVGAECYARGEIYPFEKLQGLVLGR